MWRCKSVCNACQHLTVVKHGDHTHAKMCETGERQQTLPAHRVIGVQWSLIRSTFCANSSDFHTKHVTSNKQQGSQWQDLLRGVTMRRLDTFPWRLLDVGSTEELEHTRRLRARSGRRENRSTCVVQKPRHQFEPPWQSESTVSQSTSCCLLKATSYRWR